MDSNKELDAFLSESASEPVPAPPAAPPEATPAPAEAPTPTPERPRDDAGRFAPKAEGPKPAATPEPQPEKPKVPDGYVPVSVMLEERRRAREYEQQLQQMRHPQRAKPDVFADPEGFRGDIEQTMQQTRLSDRLEMSHFLARQQFPDYGEKETAFIEAANANPGLAAAMWQHPSPAHFAYEQGKRILAMKEIGDDPATWRERERERLRQEILAERQAAPQPAQVPQAPAIPPSLASVGGAPPQNSLTGWNGGEPSLDDIFGSDANHRPWKRG